MKTITIIFLFGCINTAHSQIENFFGHWQGNLSISGLSETVKMQLIISETEIPGKWNWTIIYGEDENLKRYYFLMQTDDESRYVLDEGNSIELDFFYNDNTFHSTFIVMNNFLTSSYRRDGDELIFQIISSSLKDEKITGGEGDVPEVKSIKIYNTQLAILTRN